MQWSGHTLDQWRALDGDDQAYVVALYRTHHQIEAVLAHEQARKRAKTKPKSSTS